VTWLPPGFFAESPSNTVTAGGTVAMEDFRGNAGAGPARRLSLRVEHGSTASLSLPAGNGVSVSSTTIRGHAVRVETIVGSSAEIPGDLFILEWTEGADVYVSISASFRATLADAKLMAAGLVFHGGDVAIATPADEADIRAAFNHAYAWSAPAATVLGAVENGPSLARTLATLKEHDPETVRTVSINVRTVTFGDASHAAVSFSLSYRKSTSTPATVSTVHGGQGAVKVAGRWKVAQQGYCSVIELTGLACPDT
jgi:hypothetical protein